MWINDVTKNLKYLDFHFEVKSIHEDEDDKGKGIFTGFASTFDNIDRTDDMIVRGAFEDTLKSLQARQRQIRMFFNHNPNNVIGGFPSEKAFEDEHGLFVQGEINLKTQRGSETFELMKQGVLQDMSIGFVVREEDWKDGIRIIKQIDLWEISIVTEPANPEAQITDIKSLLPFANLPLAQPLDKKWNEAEALERIKEFTGSKDEPSEAYKKAFLVCDAGNSDDFDAYKMLVADVIDGKMQIIWGGVNAAAASLLCANSPVEKSHRPGIIKHIEQYHEKADRVSPFKDERGTITTEILECFGARDVEHALQKGMSFSKKAARQVVNFGQVSKSNQRDAVQGLAAKIIKTANDIRTKSDAR